MKRSAVACAFASISSIAFAQAPAPQGLDSLNDQRLMQELSARGLNKLLDRAFEVSNVPPAQRDSMRGVMALGQLKERGAAMGSTERQALVQNVVAGITQLLPTMTDPQALMDAAATLTKYSVELDVNTLEYWGENAQTQQELRPVVEAVVKLLDKAAAESQKAADSIANTITGPNDPRAAQWEKLATVVTLAQFNRRMVDYYHAMSLERTSPHRKQIAGEAIKALLEYDNPDSTVQPAVRNRIGKLHMTRGEYENAQEVFGSVITNKDNAIQPPPDPGQQWEARYFSAQCHLLSADLSGAQKELDELTKWQAQNLAADKDAPVLAQMLQYRVYAAQSEIGKSESAKKKANEQAVATLVDLLKKRPGLQSIIFEQLMSKLPASADLTKLDPLLLQGFVSAADRERLKPANQKADEKVLQRGVDAAREMLKRKTGVDPQFAESSALLIGFFLERQGKHAPAAEAFLDYLKRFPTAPQQNQQIALDNALVIIAGLRSNAATIDAPETVKVYERFLPVVIAPPFNRKEFAFDHAQRLLANGKNAEAAAIFRQVPQDDKRYASARFYLMNALQGRLDNEKLSAADRAAVVAEIMALVDDVTQRVTAGMNSASDDTSRMRFRSMLVRTVLLASDMARREQNDPKKTLKLLENFEAHAKGLPNEQDLIVAVLFTRVQAYMALGDSNSATQSLVTLLTARPGAEGAQAAKKILEKLNAELDAARLAGDRKLMQRLANNRAQLSGFLVDWARKNADPTIKRFTYRYAVFDAATKHLQADLTDDPAARAAGLKGALKLYQQLESPESVAMYKATLDPKSAEAKEGDPSVALGIGLIAYDLGDYAEAQKRLGTLLTNRKLGTPKLTIEESGQTKVIENDQYWEATLRLMRSNLALAAANPNDATAQSAKAETINYLKQLYIRFGREVGGAKWAPEFEKLRAEHAPDFNPDEFSIEATTQPA